MATPAGVLPSPSMMFFSDPPSHEHPYGSSSPWAWLTSPRHAHDATPQERFLSRDMHLALQDGSLHQHAGGKQAYSIGDKRKATDLQKV